MRFYIFTNFIGNSNFYISIFNNNIYSLLYYSLKILTVLSLYKRIINLNYINVWIIFFLSEI